MQDLSPITVSVLINAPEQKAWQCYTEPEHITQWSFASEDWHSPSATNDLRVGGSFTTVMAAKDGSFSFDFGGLYTEVRLHQTIAYVMADGRKVETTFLKKGENTLVTTVFDPETENTRELQQGGWQAILENFKKHVEQV
jgi:uncharacterized protein YndB with AHSA1/START domain